MGDVTALLTEAQHAGLEVRSDGARLVVRGPRSAEPLARRLLARKPEVLARLAADDEAVAWRVAVMRPQVPASGPIPFLTIREVGPTSDGCLSCGDPLNEEGRIRCSPCERAVWRVLHAVREGVDE